MDKHELEEILQHAGVKGMRWGVRKSTSSGGGRKASKESSARRKESNINRMENDAKSNVEGIKYMKSRIKERPQKDNPGVFERNKQASARRRIRNLESRETEASNTLKNIQNYRKQGSDPKLQKAIKKIMASRLKKRELKKADKAWNKEINKNTKSVIDKAMNNKKVTDDVKKSMGKVKGVDRGTYMNIYNKQVARAINQASLSSLTSPSGKKKLQIGYTVVNGETYLKPVITKIKP